MRELIFQKKTMNRSFTNARRFMSLLLFRVVLLLGMSFIIGCTVITDFDESRIKLQLNEVLFDDGVKIHTAADVGFITLEFTEPFSAKDAATFDQLFGQEITVDLAIDGRSTGHRITITRVTSLPEKQGEFRVFVDRDGHTAIITFYNGLPDNRIVASDDMIKLVLHVSENPLIATDAYAFESTVQDN